MAELLGCPFCGSDELSHGAQDMHTRGERGVVECHECGAALLADSEAEAIDAWNRRSPTQAGGDVVGALADALKPFATFHQIARKVAEFNDLPEKPDGEFAWGFNDAVLTWGDFRRARQALSALAVGKGE